MTPVASPSLSRSGTDQGPWGGLSGPRTEDDVVDLAAIEAEAAEEDEARRQRVLERFVRAHRAADRELA